MGLGLQEKKRKRGGKEKALAQKYILVNSSGANFWHNTVKSVWKQLMPLYL